MVCFGSISVIISFRLVRNGTRVSCWKAFPLFRGDSDLLSVDERLGINLPGMFRFTSHKLYGLCVGYCSRFCELIFVRHVQNVTTVSCRMLTSRWRYTFIVLDRICDVSLDSARDLLILTCAPSVLSCTRCCISSYCAAFSISL